MSNELPSPGRRRVVTALAVFPWPIVLSQFLLVLPRYERMMREFNLQSSAFVSTLIAVSTWLRAHALSAFVLGASLAFGSVLLAQWVQSRPFSPRSRWTILTLLFGIPTLLFAATWLGVWSMHRTLVEGLDR